MIENSFQKNFLFLLIATLAFFALTSPACAKGSMMGLAYIREIVLQPPRLGKPADSKKCDVSENDIPNFILPKLKSDGLPIFSLLDAPVPAEKTARIYLVPEIITMEIKRTACVSYLSMIAKSKETLDIPPIKVPRNVTVAYWKGGLMLHSSAAGHKRVVQRGFEKLSELFSRDYRLAQPPDLDWLREKEIIPKKLKKELELVPTK
ncbi:MAG TPA: hypothetical protein DD400_00765 [Rhodospirillaceae bacterium]|nr:hypothetical protein [Rhodospirillaceae bacterium]